MGQYLTDFDGKNTISTKSARVFFQEDGKNVLFAECTGLKASIKKNKEKTNTLGSFGTGHKVVGWEGTGSISGYLINSDIISAELNALQSGEDRRFNIVTTYIGNDDQGSQTYLLKSVSLDEIQLGDIKADDGLIKIETDLTFDGIELIQKFN